MDNSINISKLSRKERLKLVISDWLPIFILLVFYSRIKQYVNLHREVNISGIFTLEQKLFGWLTKFEVPTFAFVDSYNPFLIIFSTIAYSLHFVVPTIVAIRIGYVNPDRETFAKFRISIIIVTIISLFSFIIFPVAPPWYVILYGFSYPYNYTGTSETAAGLLKFDQLFNINFFSTMYSTTPPAPFAAFPSLHAAYSFLTAFVLVRAYKSKSKKIYLMYLYPLSVWFGTVFLNHHYIVDLLGGALYSLVAYFIGTKILLPLFTKQKDLSLTDYSTEINLQDDEEKKQEVILLESFVQE